MKKFVALSNGQCFIFHAQTDSEASKYAESIVDKGANFIVQEIKGLQVAHEITFALCKSLRELTFAEAEKNGITKHKENESN